MAELHRSQGRGEWDEWMDQHTSHFVVDIDPYVALVRDLRALIVNASSFGDDGVGAGAVTATAEEDASSDGGDDDDDPSSDGGGAPAPDGGGRYRRRADAPPGAYDSVLKSGPSDVDGARVYSVLFVNGEGQLFEARARSRGAVFVRLF